MARARKRQSEDYIKPKTLKHIRTLGLASIGDYQAWCCDNGFEPSLDKSWEDRAEELSAQKREVKRAKARQQVHHNSRKFLEHACSGAIKPRDIDRPGWSEVCAAIASSKSSRHYRDSLYKFLAHVDRSSDFLFESVSYGSQDLRYIDGVIRLHDRRGQWVREVGNWRPQSHNRQRQFASLTRHLMARYDVPSFMDSAWMRQDAGAYRFRDWFVHIGKGENIRTANTLFPMTSKMAHHFRMAPNQYSIEEALLWGEIHALGGDQCLTEAIAGTRLIDQIELNSERRAFWSSVYRFFIANPMLDRRHVGPITDYLIFHKFEEQEVVTEPGRVEVRPPPHPNLSMKRRTPESLLRQVETWHGSLQTFRAATGQYFKKSGYGGLILEAGSANASHKRSQWHVRELLSGEELIEEGRRMKHCVASYVLSCSNGYCSIWTLERHHANGKKEKHLTIELSDTGVVVQARGRGNRLPTEQEIAVLDTWAQHAGLAKGRYI